MKTISNTPYLPILFASLLLTACGGSDSDDTPEGDTPADVSAYAALDAASDTTQAAKLDLASGQTVADESWQVAYQKYVGFKLNGGISGTGNVEGCIANQYTALFDDDGNPVQSEFEALTLDTTTEAFEAVNKASCTDFSQDTLKTVINLSDWLSADYSSGAPVYSALDEPQNGWIIKSASADAATGSHAYARVKIKSVDVSFGATTSRKLIFGVEQWDTTTESFSDAVDSPEMDFSDERAYWDLETNTVVTASDDWDLSVVVNEMSYDLQTNAGASGTGSGGVGTLLVDDASAVTNPTDTDQVYRYFADSAVGILAEPGDYGPLQYNVGGEHKMWPTFTTYLIKDDENYYKMQVVSNYGEDGTAASSNLYIRYAVAID